MATLPQRIFAMSGAIMFFLTSIALTVVVIITIMQDKKTETDPAAGATAQSQTQDQSQSTEGKLEGTKLAGFEPVSGITEIRTTDLKPGNGKEIKSVNDTITAHYTGALAKDGTIFQSSKDGGKPFTTQLSGVIEGWQKGMIGMKEGGTRRLIIPAAQAYGAQEQGNIPANSDLVFDIELQKVGE